MSKLPPEIALALLEDELVDAIKRKEKTECYEAHRELNRQIAEIKRDIERQKSRNSMKK